MYCGSPEKISTENYVGIHKYYRFNFDFDPWEVLN